MPRKTKALNYFSGTSGLQLPFPKYKFPQEYSNSSRLTYYATLFKSIEINSSFYKIPLERTVLKWTNEVPDDFRFTFKLWQEITHAKGLEFKEEHVINFMKAIDVTGHKKGSLLIQFAPSLDAFYIQQVRSLLHLIKKTDPDNCWHLALEFRNRSWYSYEVYDLLEEYGASIVIHDLPKSATPAIDQQAKSVYLRFHGPTGNYRDSYSDSFLHEYATYVHEWLLDGKTVYTYFNNTMGDALKNLQTLNSFVIQGI